MVADPDPGDVVEEPTSVADGEKKPMMEGDVSRGKTTARPAPLLLGSSLGDAASKGLLPVVCKQNHGQENSKGITGFLIASRDWEVERE